MTVANPGFRRLLNATLVAVALSGASGALACNISATSVSFGSYNPFAGTAVDSTGSISVGPCSLFSLAYTVTLSTGHGSYSAREMRSGGNKLFYNLYTNSTRTTIWGNGSGGTGTVSGLGLLSGLVTHTVYGRIPAGQNPVVGSYSDTITATVIF